MPVDEQATVCRENGCQVPYLEIITERAVEAETRVAELEAALRPFVEAADETERHTGPWDGPAPHGITTWMADIGVWNKDVLAARAALKGTDLDPR